MGVRSWRSLAISLSLAVAMVLLALPARADDLVDLLARHTVEVQVERAGIQEVTVRIRQTARQARPIEVTIPVGTFFAAGNSAIQSMVSVAPSSVEDDAARAMKILADAGIDIKRKAIWRQDRAMLARSVGDQSLAAWLRSR